MVERDVVLTPGGLPVCPEGVPSTCHLAAVLNAQQIDQRGGERAIEQSLGVPHSLVSQRLLHPIVAVGIPERGQRIVRTSHDSNRRNRGLRRPPEEAGSVIRCCIIRRNEHAEDEHLRDVVSRANVA